MSETAVAAELASSIHLSDPLPARCSACLRSAGEDLRFVDFRAAFNGGAVIEEGSMAVRDSIDELHLCEGCVRSAAEALGYKPQLHARQILKIRRLEHERNHWQDTARSLKRALDEQLDVNLGDD